MKSQSLLQSGLRADPAVFQAWPVHGLVNSPAKLGLLLKIGVGVWT